MTSRVPWALKQEVTQKPFLRYDLQNHRRFCIILGTAVFFHLCLLAATEFQPKRASLKKMTASLFEVVAKPSSSQITINLLTTDEPQTVASAAVSVPLTGVQLLPSQGEKGVHLSKPTISQVRKRTVSAASHHSQDIPYLSRWQTYMEEYGNTHYPPAALKNNLYGELRLLVGIRRDGSIEEIRVRKSSGSLVLDQAAIELVKAAAPFEPLPTDIGQEVEVLEIIRTWQFRGRFRATG